MLRSRRPRESACGRLRSSPGTSTSIRMIAAAPTSPVSCVFAPACSATAVRDPLVLTGKPWNKPAPTFAAPMPIISLLPSISWPVRAANAEAVEIVSVSDTSAMPRAPATRSGRSETGLGQVGEGSPSGRVPTSETPWLERSSAEVAAIAATTATSTPGMRGRQRWRIRISARLATPTAAAAATASPDASPLRNSRASSIRPSASVEKPKSFDSCPTRIVSASPFM